MLAEFRLSAYAELAYYSALIALIAGCGQSPGTLPRDVQAFIDRREACDHFRGEWPEPGETERMNEVSAQINEFCTGTDNDWAKLLSKYYPNPAVTDRLSTYEKIEAAPEPEK